MGAAALAALVAAGPAAAQITEQTYASGSTADMAKLCGASSADAVQVNAQSYCEGFITGAGQFHRAVTARGGRMAPIYCLPTPGPTLGEVRTAFVAWAAANPQYAGDRAVDSLMRFAAATYPCPAPSARAGK
jgi:hypothetical protein